MLGQDEERSLEGAARRMNARIESLLGAGVRGASTLNNSDSRIHEGATTQTTRSQI